MKITLCGSIGFAHKMKELKEDLSEMGHEVVIPYTAQRILNGEFSIEKFNQEKDKKGDKIFREESKEDLIKKYYNEISNSDAVFILNFDKKDIKNYIGANTFLEMGFAHVLNKKIFLFNDIPKMDHKDEIMAMKPLIINGDLTKVK